VTVPSKVAGESLLCRVVDGGSMAYTLEMKWAAFDVVGAGHTLASVRIRTAPSLP